MNDLHFMLDLETMGTGRDAPIIAIGAARFDPFDGILDTFYRNITLASNVEAGRPIDPGTVEWWLGQSKQAQDQLLAEPRVTLYEGLDMFLAFMSKIANDEALRRHGKLWSNGPTFDEVIIRHAFTDMNIPFPLGFRGSRCCRTAIEFAKALGFEKPELGGTKHNALDDAVFQAEGVIKVFKKILEVKVS